MVEMKLIECPRDAMQGIHPFIPTGTKVEYLNALLRVGFDTIDIGSFVNPKAIPQLADTAEVLHRLDLDGVKSKLLVIVANERGAEEAVQHGMVHYVGYPFSISETFQRRNTNTDIEGSWARTAHISSPRPPARPARNWWCTSAWASAIRTAIRGARRSPCTGPTAW